MHTNFSKARPAVNMQKSVKRKRWWCTALIFPRLAHCRRQDFLKVFFVETYGSVKEDNGSVDKSVSSLGNYIRNQTLMLTRLTVRRRFFKMISNLHCLYPNHCLKTLTERSNINSEGQQ